MAERASRAFGAIAGGFPQRMLQEATQALEPCAIDAFLNPTQRSKLSILRVRLPALVALLGLGE